MTEWTFCLKSWLIGFDLGIAGKSLPLRRKRQEREPVAYLYNGVRLPKLPEWDREMYPYAYITQNLSGTVYKFVAKTTKPEASTDGKITLSGLTFAVVDGAWAEVYSQGIRKVIWTNNDLYHEDGTLYLDASDPIPVYE